MEPRLRKLSRRSFVRQSSVTLTGSLLAGPLGGISAAETAASRQANGVKVGEVTPTSAIVWTRLTANAERNRNGLAIVGKANRKTFVPVSVPVEQLEGACPGAAGRIRVRYGTRPDLFASQATEWANVSAACDSAHQFSLQGLEPAARYHYAVETTGPGGNPVHGAFRGEFETAPSPQSPSDLLFCVMTCQAYHDRDHADGHHIYASMLRLAPKFVAFTGDNVYYDSELPRVTDAALARYHWQRMSSLPRHVELHRKVAGYWQKDDHDTLSNDAWPGMRLDALEFAEGQRIFRQQVPVGPRSYRTHRWGRDLQIWLTDGRDFRSPNKMPDGPEKTIWGPEQKEWFKRTVRESDATWKVLISPTPLVGPDRPRKNDNHANSGFRHEGDELREWLRANAGDHLFVVCGDRHWQYHSVHPRTGLNEFSVGPASDAHAGGSPGLNPRYHRFHRVKGGFLTVALHRRGRQSVIAVQHRDVFGRVV